MTKIPTISAFILKYSLYVFQSRFHFLCSPLQKKVRAIESFFSLLDCVNSHRPGKIINTKLRHNPGLRGARGL